MVSYNNPYPQKLSATTNHTHTNSQQQTSRLTKRVSYNAHVKGQLKWPGPTKRVSYKYNTHVKGQLHHEQHLHTGSSAVTQDVFPAMFQLSITSSLKLSLQKFTPHLFPHPSLSHLQHEQHPHTRSSAVTQHLFPAKLQLSGTTSLKLSLQKLTQHLFPHSSLV